MCRRGYHGALGTKGRGSCGYAVKTGTSATAEANCVEAANRHEDLIIIEQDENMDFERAMDQDMRM